MIEKLFLKEMQHSKEKKFNKIRINKKININTHQKKNFCDKILLPLKGRGEEEVNPLPLLLTKRITLNYLLTLSYEYIYKKRGGGGFLVVIFI